MFEKLVLQNRSYRRFYEDQCIDLATLKELVNLARICPSGANLQPLKYILSNEPHKNSVIFPHLAWAGYLKEWPGPEEGERPAAYILILGDTKINTSFGCDHGIAAQTILLGAAEKELGGCIIGSIQREGLRKALAILPRYEILLVLALGKPKEVIQLETVSADDSIKYWRDSEGVHHVPKRSLEEILIG